MANMDPARLQHQREDSERRRAARHQRRLDGRATQIAAQRAYLDAGGDPAVLDIRLNIVGGD